MVLRERGCADFRHRLVLHPVGQHHIGGNGGGIITGNDGPVRENRIDDSVLGDGVRQRQQLAGGSVPEGNSFQLAFHGDGAAWIPDDLLQIGPADAVVTVGHGGRNLQSLQIFTAAKNTEAHDPKTLMKCYLGETVVFKTGISQYLKGGGKGDFVNPGPVESGRSQLHNALGDDQLMNVVALESGLSDFSQGIGQMYLLQIGEQESAVRYFRSVTPKRQLVDANAFKG